MVCARTGSYTIFALWRAVGPAAPAYQLVPSYSQVSASALPEYPPNMTTRLRALSKVAAIWYRTGGVVAVVIWVQLRGPPQAPEMHVTPLAHAAPLPH